MRKSAASRSERRMRADEKRAQVLKVLDEIFMDVLAKAEPGPDGNVPTGPANEAVKDWLRRRIATQPQEKDFLLKTGRLWRESMDKKVEDLLGD